MDIVSDYLVNSLDIQSTGFGRILYALFTNFIATALVEEGFKWIALHLATIKISEFDSLFDGVVYGAFVSLGFAALENVNSPKVVVNKNMNALYFSRSIIPFQRNSDKQDWLAGHTYYKHIGLYAYRADALKEITSLPQSSLEIAESLEQLRWLENGYTIKVGISQVETIGIDTPEDLEKAEAFLKQQEAK